MGHFLAVVAPGVSPDAAGEAHIIILPSEPISSLLYSYPASCEFF